LGITKLLFHNFFLFITLYDQLGFYLLVYAKLHYIKNSAAFLPCIL